MWTETKKKTLLCALAQEAKRKKRFFLQNKTFSAAGGDSLSNELGGASFTNKVTIGSLEK